MKLPKPLIDNMAVIYARFSSSNQREESIDAQVRACREYAKTNNLQVVEIYADSARTGIDDNRPEFQRMIADAKAGKFVTLLVHKLDRFSRDKYHSAMYKRELKMCNVRIVSITEAMIGSDSPESLILESVLEGMAQYYSANLAREVKKGQHETALKCQHVGGMPPLGYDVCPVTKQYVINESEAKIVRVIFEKYASGMGYSQLLNYLNSRGYQTKSYIAKNGKNRIGRPFGRGSLNGLLKNRKYVGDYIFGMKQERALSGKRSPRTRPEEEWVIVKDGMPAIVDRGTFDKVQLKMAQNLQTGGKYKAKETYLLSSLIRCGECGSAMQGNTRNSGRNKTKYSSYRCSNRRDSQGCSNKELRKEYLDNFVLDALYDNLFSESSIKKLARMLTDYNNRQSIAGKNEIAHVEKDILDATAKISTIIRLVTESGISIDTVKDELKALEDKKLYLSEHLRELQLSNAVMITDEKILELVSHSREFVQTKNIPECRNFIEQFIEQVQVYADRVEVLFKISIAGSNDGEVTALTSSEAVKTLQKEYRNVV